MSNMPGQPVQKVGRRGGTAGRAVHAYKGESVWGPSLLDTFCGQSILLPDLASQGRGLIGSARFTDPDVAPVNCSSCLTQMTKRDLPPVTMADLIARAYTL